jgi:hypothetical protein
VVRERRGIRQDIRMVAYCVGVACLPRILDVT